jgi:flagellar protein FlbD
VVLVHRLRGEPLLLNPDLIESIEVTPDTVITLVDGRKAVVSDPPDVIVERIREYRASVLAAVDRQRARSRAPLELVPEVE